MTIPICLGGLLSSLRAGERVELELESSSWSRSVSGLVRSSYVLRKSEERVKKTCSSVKNGSAGMSRARRLGDILVTATESRSSNGMS